MLVKHLPPESWTQTKLRDSDLPELRAEESGPVKFGPWSQGDYLTARLIDEVAWLRYAVARTAGDDRYPAPEPLPRPGMDRRKPLQPVANVRYLHSLRATGEATT